MQNSPAGRETPHPIRDLGRNETWDGRPLAYLSTDLASLDMTAPAFEEQLRWGFGLLSERYPDVQVLEMQLLWGEKYTFLFDAGAPDWKDLLAGKVSWAKFWNGIEKSAVDLETNEYYDGQQVDALLAQLRGAQAGPVATPTTTPGHAPMPAPSPTRRFEFSIVTSTPAGGAILPAGTLRPGPGKPPLATPAVPLGATYEDPEGFFALDYPAAWTPHRSGSEMQFWADDRGDAALAISIHIKALSAQALVEDISTLLAGKLDSYREVDRGEMALGGYPAVWVEQTYRQNGQAVHGMMAGLVRNRVGYLLLAWSPETQYRPLETTFESIAGSLRLTESSEAPLYAEWLTRKSEHFIFHYLPDTYVAREIETIAADHEWAFGEIARALGVTYAGSIDFYLYPSEEALYRATARDSGFAINEGREVHALWVSAQDHQSLGHEMTHVITSWTLGEPSEALLGEGVAVCMDHSGKDHHATAADLLRSGELIPPSKLLGDAWFAYKWAYPVSGSFVCFLLDGYGVERFKQLYPRKDFTEALNAIYGAGLSALEGEWMDMLRTGRQPTHASPTPSGGGIRPGRGPTPTPAYPLPTPASLNTFLCCGTTPGETGTIWSVSYPSGWQVTLLPNNPNQFYGALFSTPNGKATITFIPGANTDPGTPLDTGNVDDWLNRFVQIRQGEESGFHEFLRQPVQGVPDSRLWAATWGSGSERGWEAYLVVVNPLPVVYTGAPQGYLTMYGVRAASREWNNVTQTYDAMMRSMKMQRPDGSSSGLPVQEPSEKPFLVRWCPRTCDWMAVDADSPDWVGDCGEPTELWETACHPDQTDAY